MNPRRWWPALAALLIASTARSQGSPDAGEIRVVAQGLKNSTGKMFCIIFDDPKAYPSKAERAVMKGSSAITDKQASCTFAGVKPGRYAVAVFHDENGNGRLDTGFLGIPSEPTGASNDARGSMGPPKFEDAQFQYDGGMLVLKVKLE
jgi:uncharacterized protein (DUF2141 family)